jgi:hypothetical protein
MRHQYLNAFLILEHEVPLVTSYISIRILRNGTAGCFSVIQVCVYRSGKLLLRITYIIGNRIKNYRSKYEPDWRIAC